MKLNIVKTDTKILAASLLSIGLSSIPFIGSMAHETLAKSTEIQQQQSLKVSGVVSDGEGPIIGASIKEKGTSNGTVTDLDGKFNLSVKPGATIIISYMGYKR